MIYILLFWVAPLYVWRFSIGGLPTNFLMLASFGVIFVGLFQLALNKQLLEFSNYIKSIPKLLLFAIGLVGLASIVSLLVFGLTTEKLGQWMVLYAQPICIFFLLSFYSQANPIIIRRIRSAMFAFVFFAGLLAIWQYLTLDMLPAAWQGNSVEPKRAIAFFAHPNAFALFMTPILAWLIPDTVKHFGRVWEVFVGRDSWWQHRAEIIQNKLVVLAWLVGAVGLFLSLSRGAWIGLIAAAGVYALLSANKKVLISFALSGVVMIGVVFSVPNLRWRVLLPFHGEKSSIARLSLWSTGSKMIADSPILGKGVAGFSNNWDQYNTDPNLDHYNFPHNIFLNFWVDLGLFGMVGFILLILWGIWQGIKHRKQPMALSLLLFVVALVLHGLIDIPYLKNDLALVFWMILAVSVSGKLSLDKS